MNNENNINNEKDVNIENVEAHENDAVNNEVSSSSTGKKKHRHHRRHHHHDDDYEIIMGAERKISTPQRTAVTEAFDWLEVIVLSLAFVMVFFTYFGRLAIVQQTSMRCTLEEGHSLLISDFMYEPSRGDIIVFHAPSSSNIHDEPLIKRVIATGGESVYIDFPNWAVYVYEDPDGKYKTLDDIKAAGIKPLEELYIKNNPMYEPDRVMQFAGRTYPVKLAEDEVFVMGDNRQVSSDSRSFGPIKESYILGKVIVRLFPLSEFGGVD